MNASIICIGNRFVAEDAAGLLVYDRLQAMQPLPAGIRLVEGGLAGLNLLPLLEQGGRVVFVDAVAGFGQPGEIILLDQLEILDSAEPSRFGHDAGLPYVLAVLPGVCEGELPEEIVLVGLEGECPPPIIEQAARMSLVIAAHGLKCLG